MLAELHSSMHLCVSPSEQSRAGVASAMICELSAARHSPLAWLRGAPDRHTEVLLRGVAARRFRAAQTAPTCCACPCQRRAWHASPQRLARAGAATHYLHASLLHLQSSVARLLRVAAALGARERPHGADSRGRGAQQQNQARAAQQQAQQAARRAVQRHPRPRRARRARGSAAARGGRALLTLECHALALSAQLRSAWRLGRAAISPAPAGGRPQAPPSYLSALAPGVRACAVASVFSIHN